MRRAITVALVSTVLLGGCSSYWTLKDPLPGPDDAKTMRVSLKNGGSVLLENGYAAGDTLYGLAYGSEMRLARRSLVSVESRGAFSAWAAVDDPLPGPTNPTQLRATTATGRVFELADAYADADTLYGTHRGLQPATIPLARIDRIEEKYISPMKTLGLLVITLGPIAGIIALQDYSLTGF